jgi:hypothetical protein
VEVVKVGGDDARGTMTKLGNATDADASGDGAAGDSDRPSSDLGKVEQRPLPFNFDRLFGLPIGAGDNEDKQRKAEITRTRGGTPQAGGETTTRPGYELSAPDTFPAGEAPHFRIEFTMCNPPFYGSAAEIEGGFSGKETGPLGVGVSFSNPILSFTLAPSHVRLVTPS